MISTYYDIISPDLHHIQNPMANPLQIELVPLLPKIHYLYPLLINWPLLGPFQHNRVTHIEQLQHGCFF